MIGERLAPPQRALLESEYDNMLSCVRCGLCLTSCPTYVLSLHEAEGPRGRVAMARALAEGHLTITPDLVEHEQNCLVCDACTAICPAGVHMDPLQVALRSAIEPQRRRPAWQRVLRSFVFHRLFPNLALFRLVVRAIWLYQTLGVQWLARRTGLLRLLGLKDTEAFLPRIPPRFVVPKGETYHASEHPNPKSKIQNPKSTVSFFAGCVMSTALADVDHATIRVLQRAGCDVINTAGQGCCGALNAHGGDLEAARAMMKRTIAAFERDGDTVVIVNSAGCGAMLKDYAHHLRDDPQWAARAAAFTARVRDITEFLATRDLPMHGLNGSMGAPAIGAMLLPPGTSETAQAPQTNPPLETPRTSVAPATAVAYQDACHLAHAQRISRQPRALLRAIPGLELREMAESTLCCGSAGIYNVTNPAESRRLQQRKLDNALATGAQVIATANPGCLLQLQSGLRGRGSPVQVKHIVELLDEASGP